MSGTPWTTEEVEKLKKFFPTEGYNVVKRFPARTSQAIFRKASFLNIQCNVRRDGHKKWSAKERSILIENYPVLGVQGILARDLLPGRGVASIDQEAKSLSLHFIGPHKLEERLEDENEQLKKKILAFLKGKGKGQKTLLDICTYVDKGPKTVKGILNELQEAHYTIAVSDHSVILHDQAPIGKKMQLDVEGYFGNAREVTFGVVSDLHYCNIHAREDLIQLSYDSFKREGVPIVFLPGNMIDGEIFFNTRELLAGGIEGQVRYLVEHAPKVKGVTTYFVTGEDHEGWLAKKAGIDIGKVIEARMHESGRDDWVYLSNLEADIAFKTKKGETVVRIAHPGGGTAYATSYTPQKIIESLQGGEKPHVFLCGHYHKLGYWPIRNVHTILTGTHEDQTPFMRKKHIESQLGFWIVTMKLKEDGTILEFNPRCFPYLDKKVYQVNKDYPVQAKELTKDIEAKPSKTF